MRSLRILSWLCVLALFAMPLSAQSPYVVTCAEDTHIDKATKDSVDSVATRLIALVLGPDPMSAFDLFSKDGQASVSRERLGNLARGLIGMIAPTDPAIQHTYLIELKGTSPGNVVCGTDFSKPDGWESFRATNVPRQAYVLMSAAARNNKIAFSVWLVSEQGGWKVQSVWMNVSSLADKDSAQLWELARAQQADNHNLNAALLYAAALQTADRGPNVQMGIPQSISKDASTVKSPPEVTGQPPFLWTSGKITYKILSVGPIAIAGKIYIVIAHEVSPWQTDEQVDGWNKELLKYFKSRFPEYSDVFAGLVARAVEQGTRRGYGTVEELPTSK